MKRTALIAVVVMALVFGLVAYASAANTVVVNATVNPKAELTMANQTLSLSVDPEMTDSDVASFSVKSNKAYSVLRSTVGGSFTDASGAPNADFGFVATITPGDFSKTGKDGRAHTDTMSITPTYDVNPGSAYTQTFTYSVTF